MRRWAIYAAGGAAALLLAARAILVAAEGPPAPGEVRTERAGAVTRHAVGLPAGGVMRYAHDDAGAGGCEYCR